MVLWRDGGEHKDELGEAGGEGLKRDRFIDEITRLRVDVLSLPQLVFFDEIDRSLRKVATLDFQRWHPEILNKWPESIANAAAKVEQNDGFSTLTLLFGLVELLAELSELSRQVMPVLVKVCRVLLVENVPVPPCVNLQPLDAHLGQFGRTFVLNNRLSLRRHLLVPFVIPDLAVDFICGRALLGFSDGVDGFHRLSTWLFLFRICFDH